MSSIWYTTTKKPTSSGLKHDVHLYTCDQWTLLSKIVVGGFFFASFLFALIISGIALSATSHPRAKPAAAAATATANAAQPPPPKPNLFIRLGDVEGLGPCASPPASPAFQLIVDADWLPPGYRYCSGGGNSMLRVSHRGIVLAWGHVPWFCVQGRGPSDEDGDGGVDEVVTVEARADGAVLREEVRRSVRTDLCVEGKARFSVEGEVAGLGYLRCQTSLFQDKATETEEPCPCLVQ
ncbi:hypothetical protein BDA96_01G156600 [Sorghum bicolor]|uniref:Uncharacterized protein n=2 Tax=Sorghum bicolor TaxID=4558 RepID=A0A921RXJ3_SORBI|nr:uncharacterized protein LOC8056773 [Sorghum bicolor]EER93726.1 hypothetical protein SORBI_3001G149300 [Sorghum bicolor]KAG0548318.1 hypothetical protein BDA96_01G156600 [Sorghum bicolor]KAG0548319.1 hypothetical protein BDA96_01G156600 [Sorghum bicolor]KXG37907.1 hypothetical protein SORBI_3001G149300 [Sorghum bicolor]|eukprot:XP_002466728.1 uncharacterized protein LOC8056773 [Sorghum bicolor]